MGKVLMKCCWLFFCCWSLFGAEDPLTLEASADVNLSSTEAGRSAKVDGERATLRLMGEAEKHRICLFFDLKDQAAKPCRGAILKLVTDKCWPNSKATYIRVHRLVRPFAEFGSSWTDLQHPDMWINPGGDFDPAAVCARRIGKDDGGEGKTIDFDVTPLVQAWQSKAALNLGFILLLEDTSDMNIHVHSRQATDASKRPKLALYYAAPPPKISDMQPLNALKPLGTLPQLKTEVLTPSLNKAALGVDYKFKLEAKGGILPYTWKAAGLPEGLTLGENGQFAGKPAKAGSYDLNITVTGADKRNATAKLNLIVGDADKKDPVAVAGGTEKIKEPEKKTGKLDDE